jgi:hypothetical protein
LSVVSSGAYAVDWSLNSTLSETVEANNNPFLLALAAGTFSSYSTIAANATARTPTSKFTFDGSVSYQKYWGAGVDGFPSENLQGGTNLHYETYGKNNSDRQYPMPAGIVKHAFALLGQFAIVTNTRLSFDTTWSAAESTVVTALDLVSLSAFTYTSYDPGTPARRSSTSAAERGGIASIRSQPCRRHPMPNFTLRQCAQHRHHDPARKRGSMHPVAAARSEGPPAWPMFRPSMEARHSPWFR